MKPGDKILGLASSGVHSNGFSLVRKIVENIGGSWQDSAPFDAQNTLAEIFLTPTRIYVKSLLAAMQKNHAIRALAHITGGGFSENIPRVLPAKLAAKIDLAKIDIPPVFGWLAIQGNVAHKEMLRTFNCGVGMVVIVEGQQCEKLTAEFERQGERVFALGEICQRTGDSVIFENQLNL